MKIRSRLEVLLGIVLPVAALAGCGSDSASDSLVATFDMDALLAPSE